MNFWNISIPSFTLSIQKEFEQFVYVKNNCEIVKSLEQFTLIGKNVLNKLLREKNAFLCHVKCICSTGLGKNSPFAWMTFNLWCQLATALTPRHPTIEDKNTASREITASYLHGWELSAAMRLKSKDVHFKDTQGVIVKVSRGYFWFHILSSEGLLIKHFLGSIGLFICCNILFISIYDSLLSWWEKY